MLRTPTRALVALSALVGLASVVHAATITITSTIVIAAGATYDGGGNTIKASGMGDGGQGESQSAFFRLGANSWLKNVKLAAPGVDGCHFYGNGTMNEVTWQDVGEDQFTEKTAGNCWVSGGSAVNGADKFGQCNAAGSLTLYFHTQTNGLKNIRQNGGTTYTCNFYYDNNTANQTKEAVGRTDSSTTRFGQRNIHVNSFSGSNGWWYGRASQAFTY
jgi:pectate lyase C